MTPFQITLLSFYLGCSIWLASYALHGLVMVWYFARRVGAVRQAQAERIERYHAETPPEALPLVTTQLPLYNEAEVVERLLRAVCAIDYPAERHHIQVLDDSTDDSRDEVDQIAAELRAEGHWIDVVRREQRVGFKAGALAEGMGQSEAEYLAIFDADFVPPRDFLRKAIPLLVEADDIACVQGRWTHLNRDENWLTRAQSVGIDGHFAVEQGARAWNGLFMNFNGTAGVWRRAAIDRAGGWQGDTLTEDLDLSYRAQLAGDRIVYCLDIPCPAEVPPTVDALKSQQRRWARGSIQTARKLLGRIWREPGSLERKVAATFHLTHYVVGVLMTLLALLTMPVLIFVPFMQLGSWLLVAWSIVLASAASPCISYVCAGRVLGHASYTLRNIPGLIVLGSGLSLNNALAVMAGLFGGRGTFVRTPKSGGASGGGRYRAQRGRLWWLELSLGVYCGWALIIYFTIAKWMIGMFLGFYTVGYLALGWASRPWRRVSARPALEPAADSGAAPADSPPALQAAREAEPSSDGDDDGDADENDGADDSDDARAREAELSPAEVA